jgi:hypothetical protein
MDMQKCAEGKADPNGETLIPVVMPIVEAAAAVRQGLVQGVGDLGLTRYEVVFALALQTLLSDPTAADRLLAGEDIFAADRAPEVP